MAIDMFIKIGNIEGESRDSKHAKEIDVLSWSWGMTQSGSAHLGTGAGSGKVNVNDLSFTKYVDRSSTALMLAVCKGTHYDKALLTVRKAGDNPLEYIKITLEDLIVSNVTNGGSGHDDRISEQVSLNFAKFKVEYTEQDAKGAAGKTSTAGWDVAANKAT